MENLEQIILEMKDTSTRNSLRIDTNERDITEMKVTMKELSEQNIAIIKLANSVENIATQMDYIKNQGDATAKVVANMDKRFSELENAPDKKTADTVTKIKLAIYTTIATAIASGILALIINLVKQ